MMTRIKVLPAEIAQQIAAGEVIERPASVVKELVENSVDAQATQIVVEIRGGGTESIRVQDNGVGIAKDELVLAFQPHATSKIESAEDLFALFTLGFRGEALPSMASAAKVRLVSRTQEQEHAYQIRPSEPNPKPEPVGAPLGTTVEVTELFYNLPARRKFLKSEATERRMVVDIVTRLALAHPHISFRLVVEGKQVLATPGNGRLLDTILVIEGRNIQSQLIKFRSEFVWGEVRGYLGRPSLAKGNRRGQFFILNGRVISSVTIQQALEKAYGGLLPSRSFPWAVVVVDVDPKLVDCNVHPAKAEVRFADEQRVFSDLMYAYRQGLAQSNLAPALSAAAEGKDERIGRTPRPASATQAVLNWEPKTWEHMDRVLRQYRPRPMPEPTPPKADLILKEERPPLPKLEADSTDEVRKQLLEARIIGQLHQTYILLEVPSGLWILDQHIVHERILLEELTKEWETASLHVQEILPQMMEFTPAEAALVQESIQQLAEFGLELEPFGENTFLLRAVPSQLAEGTGKWKQEILEIAETAQKTTAWQQEALITLACRGAVKAGEYLDERMMAALVKDLAATSQPYTCPHGRPIIIRLENNELLRRFGRI